MTASPHFHLDSYHYDLPEENIAQNPTDQRDKSRLLFYDANNKNIGDFTFDKISDCFRAGDLVIVNDTKVFPARLLGRKETGGKVEFLVLEYPHTVTGEKQSQTSSIRSAVVTGLTKSSKRIQSGQKIIFSNSFYSEVIEVLPAGKVKARLYFENTLENAFDQYGQIPLPPYIRREDGEYPEDRDRYQTVYASEIGAVAAPTAGLHFTDDLISSLKEKKVAFASVTLHVGYGTFAPVRAQDIREHNIHAEYVTVPKATADKINATIDNGGRIWAVGTTSVRALEFAADASGIVHEKSGWCDLYIYPGYKFKIVRNLVTNFHLPGSSLLFLVSALIGREELLRCYKHAVAEGYRFFSYGDAMLIRKDP
jgi:S-adenosylmethionine:tRNA ribosyltransferase-isomerase